MPIAKYLDKYLTPLIIHTRSYIRDIQHFLDKIKNVHCDNDDLLVIWDVTGLYTAIPHELGIEACRRLIQKNII